MRVASVQLDGFAGLEGRRDFGPGLNVVVGPNESGKSRLVAAIHYGLCGRVKKRGRGLDPVERYRPWDAKGRGFRLSLTLELESGHIVEVNQNLDEPGRSRVIDVDLGRDLTTELLVDRAPDASRLLGLERDVVARTLWVGQGDLLAVREGADAMQSMLQRAATSGALDETANAAIARLEQFKAERVGTEHASSKRPLRVARDLEAQTRRSLDELRALGSSLADERASLLKRRAELSRLEAGLEVARARETRDEAARLERLLARFDAIDDELETLEPLLMIEGPEVDGEALRRFELELRTIVETPPPHLPTTPHPESIAQELAALPLPPSGDRQPRPELERLEQARQVARATLTRHDHEQVEDAAQPAGLDAHTLRECARELSAPAPIVPESGRGDDPTGLGLLAMVSLALGLVALGLGVGLESAFTLVIGVAVVAFGGVVGVVARGRQRRSLVHEAERRAAEADLNVYRERRGKVEALLARSGFAGADAAALVDAALRYEATLDRSRARRLWLERRAELEARLVEIERQWMAALHSVGESDWEGYLESCRKRQCLDLESRRRVDLERLLETARRDHEAHESASRLWTSRLESLERAALHLGSGAISLSRDTPVPTDALSPLDARIAQLRTRERARQRQHELQEERSSLLGRDDKAALIDRLAALRPRVALTVSTSPERGISSAELERQIAVLQREVAQREAALNERLRGLPSIAELEERLDLAQREHARLRRLDRLVAVTIEQLMLARDTIHRDIAPRLSASLTAVIPCLTGGRWERARIAVDDLAVSVLRDHEWRPAHDLSCGTAEQVYLALRVILATTLAKANEPPPLILDDVLVHADGDRREELLGWLVELSQRHQIILTTHDHTLVPWARAQGARVHELP